MKTFKVCFQRRPQGKMISKFEVDGIYEPLLALDLIAQNLGRDVGEVNLDILKGKTYYF